MMVKSEFEESLDKVRALYERELRTSDWLRKKLDYYDQNEEIKKARENLNEIWSRALYIMQPKEQQANKAFVEKHFNLHPRKNLTYTYSLTGTGLGTIIKVTCPLCGETEDITDTSSW